MVEYLAIPAWDTPPKSLDDWVGGIAEAGGAATVRRESSTVCWLLAPTLDMEGYVVVESGHPTAINFEIKAADPGRALAVITAAAHSLGWEVHEEGDDDGRDDELDTNPRINEE